jgi:chromosomal replication initiator protein
MEFETIVEEVKRRMDITVTAMTLWIEPLKAVEFRDNRAILYSADPYIRRVAVENFSKQLKDGFTEVMGFPTELEILIAQELTLEQKTKVGLAVIPELQDDTEMISKLTTAESAGVYQYTFDTFIIGESNKLAYSACRSISQGRLNQYNPLFIYSQPGLGKTHLLSAVKHTIEANFPQLKIKYATSETFVSEYVDSLRNNTNPHFRESYRNLDLLLIDDVQFFSGKKESQIELFNTFNDLKEKGRQIIFTSDRPPREILDIEPRLRTRFEWGLLADIQQPEFETRLAIIKRKAELIGLEIPQNVMEFLADKLKENIRQLEGAILKINAMCSINDSKPTILMAQNVVREVLTEQQPIPVTVERIIAEVATIYNVSPEEMRSTNRSQQISTARQVAIFVVNRLTGLSYTAIGQEFSGRDHSTIVYAISKVKQTMKSDAQFRATVEDIIKNIGNM